MQKAKCGRHSAKSKNRFTLCCFCLGSSNSDADLNIPLKRQDAYDCVVEKLTIKKVPMSLFAADEDLTERQSETALIEPNKLLNVPVSTRDKRSAAVFSPYYTMIQKGNDYPSNSQLKKPDLEPVLGRIEAKPNTHLKIKAQPVSKPNDKFKTEPEEMIKEVIRVEVQKDQNEILKDACMTQKLQETISELGSKKMPTGSFNVNHRTGKLIPHQETNVQKDKNFSESKIRDLLLQHIMKPEEIQTEIDKSPTLQLPVVMNDSKALLLLDIKQLKPNDEVITPENIEPDEPTREQGKPKSKKVELKSSINLSNFVLNTGAKPLTSQKWRIIIKEHGKQESTSPSSMSDTSDEGIDEEEMEMEETESE